MFDGNPKPVLKSCKSIANTEHDDDLDATYLVTPNQHCQNPSHAHHINHHNSSYRCPVTDTVVEESTGGSVVTVINNTSTIRANNSTPDIVLTNFEMENATNIDEDTFSNAARTLSIRKLKRKLDESVDPSKLSTLSLLSSATKAPEIEPITNNNETGTDSIQKQ